MPEVDASTITDRSFTVNVTATDATSKVAKYEYYVNGEKKVAEEKGTAVITELTSGTTNEVYVRVYDGAGLYKDTGNITVEILAAAPKVTIANKDTWTKNKQVTIETRNGFTIRYTTDGSDPTATKGTIYNGAFTIDSNCTIKAVYISNTNKVGIIGSQSTDKIDKINPSKATLTKGTVHAETIGVTATGEDKESGIKSYEFQISTTSATEGFTTKKLVTTTSGTATYTYEGLIPATKHYLRVIVTDNAGNKTTGTAIEVTTYCKTTYCEGIPPTSCPDCYGSGGLHNYYYVSNTYHGKDSGSAWSDVPCAFHAYRHSMVKVTKYKYNVKCTDCGLETGFWNCASNGGTYGSLGRGYLAQISVSIYGYGKCPGSTCSSCGGTGVLAGGCTHSATGPHYTCEHYTNCDFTEHEI